MNDGIRMPLRPDREVESLPSGDLEIGRDRHRIEIQIRIDECDPHAVRRERARAHCIALAEVAVVVNDPDSQVTACSEQTFGRVVDRAVGYDDGLDVLAVEPVHDRTPNRTDVVDDLVPAVVNGHHDG